MKFAAFPLDQAEGSFLAHTTRLPGRVIQKGTRLDAASVAAFKAAGFDCIIAARLEAGDVGENEAAARLAEALLNPGLRRLPAGTGRVNLEAAVHGLLRVDVAQLEALNRLDEGLTIATLPSGSPVRAGDMLATIKIIPFAVAGQRLQEAEILARANAPLCVQPFKPLRVALCLSTRPGLKPTVIQSTIDVTRQRIEQLGGTLLPPVQVAHTQQAIEQALTQLIATGADLLLFAGASAVVDRADVGPAAIISAGGVVEHFGMPVDPGNLMCLGRIGAVPVLILPGCARSPSLNGIDLVLRLIFAGEPAGREQIAAMGAGGLLKEFAARPAPRAGRKGRPPKVAAIILAAGLSARMAPANKLLVTDPAGRAMIARVALNCLQCPADHVIVVLGHQADLVEQAVRGAAGQSAKLHFVTTPDYAAGLSASLRAGLAQVPDTIQAALVCLGDMPLVTPDLMALLISAYAPQRGRAIVAARSQGRFGNPVLWDRQFFGEMMALEGDTGARALLRKYNDRVFALDVETEAILTDFDTAESLAGFR